MNCEELQRRHKQEWTHATQHRFLLDVKSGQIADRGFNVWLVQDRLFVKDLCRVFGSALAQCPEGDHGTVLSGLSALKDELEWFAVKGKERGVSMEVEKLSACDEYVSFLRALRSASYVVQILSIWAIEACYNVGWKHAAPAAGRFEEFVQRWTADPFSGYVEQIRACADTALARATGQELADAERAFCEICRLEVAFWDMAYTTR